MTTFRISLALLAFGSLWLFGAAAQTPALQLAVEVPIPAGGPPHYVTINPQTRCFSFLSSDSLRFLPNSDSRHRPSLLQLSYNEEGDKISVTATVYYGNVNPDSLMRKALDKDSVPDVLHKTLGTWSGSLNQTIPLTALARIGIAPITLTIVAAEPEHPWQPTVASKAPSLQMDYAPADRTFSLVTIRNLSDKPVTALRVAASSDDGRDGSAQEALEGHSGKPLIAPGAAYQMRFNVPASGHNDHGVWVESPRPSTLVLQAAIFADGSYEGDSQFAIAMEARVMGQQAEARRLNALVAPILADTAATNEARIAKILAVIDQSPVTPDAQMLASLSARFPSLTQQEMEIASQQFGLGMRTEKQAAQHMTSQYQTDVLPHRPDLPLSRWWTSIQ